MKWEEFITPIRKAEISSQASPKIIEELFDAGGYKCRPSESTPKKWLDGTRNCKASFYFPDGEVNVYSR